jgi:hypothetical protein
MRVVAPLLLIVPLAAAGCGGSKDAAISTSSSASTMAAYVAAGNKVCIAADRRIFKIGRLNRDPKGWAKTAAAARTGVAQMRKVKPAPRRSAAFDKMLRYAQALTLSIEQVHAALVKSDVDTAAAAQFAAAQLQDKVHTAARTAGLTFCQQQLTNWPA